MCCWEKGNEGQNGGSLGECPRRIRECGMRSRLRRIMQSWPLRNALTNIRGSLILGKAFALLGSEALHQNTA